MKFIASQIFVLAAVESRLKERFFFDNFHKFMMKIPLISKLTRANTRNAIFQQQNFNGYGIPNYWLQFQPEIRITT